MSEEGVDTSKRWFLTISATVAGSLGAGIAAVPLISSMNPSLAARAAGAPVDVDISKLEPGQLIRVLWRGKPVWVLNRSRESLDALPSLESKLRDPLSKESIQPEDAKNPLRSKRQDIFVALGVCTHLGCSPTYRPDLAPLDLGAEWLGGFFCPCHGSRFDLAGRVYKGVPAPTNLEVPPHRYASDTRLIIGEDVEKS
jgi:ubiquinol-cytochrome c reductase iron-sulfur subunit